MHPIEKVTIARCPECLASLTAPASLPMYERGRMAGAFFDAHAPHLDQPQMEAMINGSLPDWLTGAN